MAPAPRSETPQPHIYPLDPQKITAEEIAVIFAMTSRRPEPFDEIAKLVTAEKAADFHERWVVGYGHASVAEHAVLHLAVENISRLACDALEDNRLASYTEKSSRYQVMPPGSYHVPAELEGHPLRQAYVETCEALFAAYQELVRGTQAHLGTVRPRQNGERDAAYSLRLRREATDSCRFVLPAATLTNVGVTMNARTLEHAITKLLSSEMAEEHALGKELKQQGQAITPTLVKYAEKSAYLAETRAAQRREGERMAPAPPSSSQDATLVHHDPQAEEKVAAAFLYRYASRPYLDVWDKVLRMDEAERRRLIGEALSRLGPHDAPIRELEQVYYTFELVLDYGAYREFKRHRMQSYFAQPLTVELGYVVPPLLEEAGLGETFRQAMASAEAGYRQLASGLPLAAQYLVTHAHKRRVLATMDLRQCYHLFKLRTQPSAHFSLVAVMQQALEAARRVHPALFQHLRLRA
ncbi:MAG: FAD-dependent thymidylate synthase [Chloroflexi bacterium]|nr:FAD-dependent thymidylate synthase [Chloroflexota bacterium]